LLGGLIVFAWQTSRLRLLGSVMRSHAGINDGVDASIRFPVKGKTNDEIDALGMQFNAMAEKINEQILELKRTDGKRREMVANVSHDLRTPLTTMKGYIETLLLKRGELSPDQERQYLETALHHSQHLGDLVEDLFELARLDSCESVVYSESFSMGELVQDVTQSFMLRAKEKNIQLYIAIHKSMVKSDDTIISYHLLNLYYDQWLNADNDMIKLLATRIPAIYNNIQGRFFAIS